MKVIYRKDKLGNVIAFLKDDRREIYELFYC